MSKKSVQSFKFGKEPSFRVQYFDCKTKDTYSRPVTLRAEPKSKAGDSKLEANHQTSDILDSKSNLDDIPGSFTSRSEGPQWHEQSTGSLKYSARKEWIESEWSKVRDSLFLTVVEESGPTNFCSTEDCENLPQYRCRDCGPQVHFCLDCCLKQHQLCKFHCVEAYESEPLNELRPTGSSSTSSEDSDDSETSENHFRGSIPVLKLTRPDGVPLRLQRDGRQHSCSTVYSRLLTLWDSKGRPQSCEVEFCNHENECLTLARHELWPSSPSKPTVAFSFQLLDWLVALQLDGRVATNAFCSAIRWKNSSFDRNQYKNVYRSLVGSSLDEYRHMVYRLRSDSLLSVDADADCPACPESSGKMFLSADGNFGLTQTYNGGTSFEAPKHADRFFLDQEEVDKVVQQYGNSDTKSKDCNSFLAGDAIRSKNSTAKLRFTGVFGCACKHEIPKMFLNMRHGERLSYVVHMLNAVTKSVGEGVQLYLLYDIACVLSAHLKRTGQDSLLQKLSLAIPIFHCYGHQAKCQVLLNPRRLDDFGLVDGEQMERLWAYLRRFAGITKEMSPSRRIDLLSDALLHYRDRKLDALDEAFVRKLAKCKAVEQDQEAQLSQISQDLQRKGNGPITPTELDEWKEEEKNAVAGTRGSFAGRACWKEKYVDSLQLLASTRQQLRVTTDADSRAGLQKQLARLDRKLRGVEGQRKVKRWSKSYALYKMYALRSCRRKLITTLKNIQDEARNVHFMKSVRRLYAGGQKAAARIAVRTKKHCQCLRKLCAKYNDVAKSPYNTSLPKSVSYEEEKNPMSGKFAALNQYQSSGNIPSAVKRMALDADCMRRRAVEEREHTVTEAYSAVSFFNRQLDLYDDLIASVKGVYQTSGERVFAGKVTLLTRNRKEAAKRLDRFLHVCSAVEDSSVSENEEFERDFEDSESDSEDSNDSHDESD